MYQMPSESLVQRMHTLISHMRRIDADAKRTDETSLMMIEANSIMDALEKEYEKPVNKFRDFNEFDQQVILYSKDWYKETDSISDLKIVMSKIALIDIKYVKDIDVLMQVAGTLHKIWAVSNGPTNWDMGILYKDTWESPLWKLKESITLKDQIDSLLRVIHHKKVDTFPKLPAPSTDYLPLAHEDTLERWAKLHEPLTSSKV